MKRRDYLKVFFGAFVFVFLMSMVFAQESEVSSTLLKVSLKQDEQIQKTITITSETDGEFYIETIGVKGVSIEEDRFILGQQRSKDVVVEFDSTGLKPGVYVGIIRVNGPVDKSDVPLIFEVESKKVLLDANLDIPPVYSEIERGSKLVYQTKVFDLAASGGIQTGLGAITVDAEYKVIGLDGKILISKGEQILVNKQTQTSNTITFPEEVTPGTYVLAAIITYDGSLGTSTQIFTIKEKQNGVTKIAENSNYTLLILVCGAIAIFLLILVIFVYLLRERDKILFELRRYNNEEIKHVKALLEEQEKTLRERRKPIEQRITENDIKNEVNAQLQKLKKKQEKRVNELTRIRKAGKINEMEKKLKEWKSQGYSTYGLDYKMKGLSTMEMEKILKKWKSKYKTKKNQRV